MPRLNRHARGGDLPVAWVGEGWRPLVEACHKELEAVFPEYELLNVKQKYGELAFRAFPRPHAQEGRAFTREEMAALYEITGRFAARSVTVCEWCGADGVLRDGRRYWITLCDACDATITDPPGGLNVQLG